MRFGYRRLTFFGCLPVNWTYGYCLAPPQYCRLKQPPPSVKVTSNLWESTPNRCIGIRGSMYILPRKQDAPTYETIHASSARYCVTSPSNISSRLHLNFQVR